jgi:SAM-dependent methyltransferase
MKGSEVNELQKPENQIEQDKDKSKQYLITKLHILNVAYHNLECGYIKDWDKQQYGFIPFPCGSFCDMLIEASVYFGMDTNKRFLDIGCGPGTKLLMAKCFFDAYGIEVIERFIEQGRVFGLTERIFNADALLFEQYADYDVLYFYRPFKEAVFQRQLEDRIYAHMKRGALLSPMHTLTEWADYPDVEQVGKYLYLKK